MSDETRPSVAPATMTMGWNHPRHGRVLEALCASHEQSVLGALTTLGIGCIGERLTYAADCGRCVATASRVSSRDYVAVASAPEEYGDPSWWDAVLRRRRDGAGVVTTDTKRRALESLAAAAVDAERRLTNVYDLAKEAETEGATTDDIRAAMTTNAGMVLRALNDDAPVRAGAQRDLLTDLHGSISDLMWLLGQDQADAGDAVKAAAKIEGVMLVQREILRRLHMGRDRASTGVERAVEARKMAAQREVLGELRAFCVDRAATQRNVYVDDQAELLVEGLDRVVRWVDEKLRGMS